MEWRQPSAHPIPVVLEDFERIHRLHQPRVVSFVRAQLHLDDVDDAVAQTFVTAWRKRPAGPGLWQAWFAVATLIGLAVRRWLVIGAAPSWWQDSYDYDAVGVSAVFSKAMWAGQRPPLMPLLLGATGGEPGRSFVTAQAVVAALCWGWLAAELAVSMSNRSRATLAVAAVVGFSFTDSILMWDRQVLTESITLSMLAATVATSLRFGRRRTPGAAVAVVAAGAALALARDTAAVALIVPAVVVVVAGRRSRLVVGVGAGVAAVALTAVALATVADRGAEPASHVYFARVLPYPERVLWFEDHGMPQADRFLVAAPPAEGAPVVAPARDDATFSGWWRWFDKHGQATWRRYVAEHPWYLLTEPLREPERGYNNAEGSVSFYRPAGMSKVPAATALLWPGLFATLVGLAIAGAAELRRRYSPPEATVAALLVLGGGVYAAVSWHSDAMESARHVFIGGVCVRLALLVLVAGLWRQPHPGGTSQTEWEH